MIRFYDRQSMDKSDLDIVIIQGKIMLNESIWNDGKEYFKRNLSSSDMAVVQMLQVEDEDYNTSCYAYQDKEANRELRMLHELEDNQDALQFGDIFPEIRQVIVCGCNELAYYFVKYLEKQHISVSVTGKYWECFGYKNTGNADLYSAGQMIVYAEDRVQRDLYQTVIRSVSSEFECIDRIYEANVLKRKMQDMEGNFADVLEKLRETKRKIVILGTTSTAQDVYDLLCEHGIDLYCFAEEERKAGNTYGTLLGKKVSDVGELLNSGDDLIFINCEDRHSALGTKSVDFFSYYGYERNKSFFLLRDYTDIPCSNLIHILKGKNVRLVGDIRLCTLLADYLNDVEQGDVAIRYVELSQCRDMKETDILCTVYPWYGPVSLERNPVIWKFRKELSDMPELSYTDYFSCVRAFVMIDLHRNRGCGKYSMKQILPKGILLGRIPKASGNIFFRGVLDGHPDILKWGYNTLNNNLFLYCICLSHEKSDNIIKLFEQIYNEEYIFQYECIFSAWDKFKKSMEDMLSLKEYFTSQELFMIFHIAYAEMINGGKIADICNKVIYWEPHDFPREEFPFLAQWLEDKEINGQTIFIHRDNMVWMGSCYKFYKDNPFSIGIIREMSREHILAADYMTYQHWEEFHVRFEDIKLHPKNELLKICHKFGISWSDTMLRTTENGMAWDYEGISDFDLKPVFNKYEEYFSEFDRFRISLISSAYQKKYGYTYEDCMKFSRKELWEMFLKEFCFQKNLSFVNESDRKRYNTYVYEVLSQQLWEARRHAVLGDIISLFQKIQIGEYAEPRKKKEEQQERQEQEQKQNQKENLTVFIRQQRRLVLYGVGRDCLALLEDLGEVEQEELVFCDLRAKYEETTFQGKKVIEPEELCGVYKEYPILVTSSMHYKVIQQQLQNMGVSSERITCNTTQLWG